MYLAHFDRFHVCYGDLADILVAKTVKKPFIVDPFCMYPEH